MEETKEIIISSSGTSIAKNTIYNILGNIIPLFFAVVFIPLLVNGLGEERFGVLSIAWMIVGYFSFFDFGLGRGLTKIIAEKIGTNQTEQIAKIFWTSLLLMISFSLLATIGLSFIIPTFIEIFKISEGLRSETKDIFYVLVLSIPLITSMTAVRGLLEAYQKFAVLNVMKVSLGISTFVGPLIVLAISDSLFWVIVFLVAARVVIWILFLLQGFKVCSGLKNEIGVDFNSIKPVIKFSVWITIGNLIVPIIFYSDRFLIGALISAAAVTYYVTPFEVATKLLVIPVALTGVLFPIFSASFSDNKDKIKKIFIKGVKFTFLTIYPFVFIVVSFSYEGIQLWLGKEFADKSSTILQLLAVGIFMNSLSLIPNNLLQGIGKPKIPTIINLVEFPIYILLMWFSIKLNGIIGAAMVFAMMATLDAVAMYIAANRNYTIRFESKQAFIFFLIMITIFIIPLLLDSLVFKIFFVIISLTGFILISWNRFLSTYEKAVIISKIKFK